MMISPEQYTEPFLTFRRPEATTLSRESPTDQRDEEGSAQRNFPLSRIMPIDCFATEYDLLAR